MFRADVQSRHPWVLEKGHPILRQISLAQFARKYPLSTLHLLMWLTNAPMPERVPDPYLLWLPDSTWIVAQKYVSNVADWLQHWLPHPFLLSIAERCRTEEYEAEMMKFLGDFALNVPLKPGRGQIRSQWLGIHGYQCRYDNPAVQGQQVQQTLNYLARLADWRPIVFPLHYRQIAGVKNRHNSDLADFLRREEVFFYALPNAQVINYTSFDNF